MQACLCVCVYSLWRMAPLFVECFFEGSVLALPQAMSANAIRLKEEPLFTWITIRILCASSQRSGPSGFRPSQPGSPCCPVRVLLMCCARRPCGRGRPATTCKRLKRSWTCEQKACFFLLNMSARLFRSVYHKNICSFLYNTTDNKIVVYVERRCFAHLLFYYSSCQSSWLSMCQNQEDNWLVWSLPSVMLVKQVAMQEPNDTAVWL